METIQELTGRLEELMHSVNEDKNNNKFLAHKYMVISLHAHTELQKLKNTNITSSEKLRHAKLRTLYEAIENETKQKEHDLTAEEIYNKINSILELAKNANT